MSKPVQPPEDSPHKAWWRMEWESMRPARRGRRRNRSVKNMDAWNEYTAGMRTGARLEREAVRAQRRAEWATTHGAEMEARRQAAKVAQDQRKAQNRAAAVAERTA